MLEVESVDWHLLENGKDHHTDKYEIVHEESTPVLRRSQPFNITITFKNRPFDETKDRVRLFFEYERSNSTPRLQQLLENMTLTWSNKLNDSKESWSIQLTGQDKNNVSLWVRSPPTAAWGTWLLSVKTSLKTEPKSQMWKCPQPFYLILNPWAKDDDVYMPDTKYLDEYVLNDVGKVYTSSSKKPIGMKWIFGQFASPVIKVIKKLIDDEVLKEEELHSPVDISQLILKVGNIVYGNWSGDYEGGTPPWLWTGSVPIFEEYLTTGNPAKFAQCFVYAAILTTGLRAAGIPSRNNTNFISSMGGVHTLALNYVYDSKGETVSEASVWNFHVWNDAWMARYDLPPGFGGWQAIDATSRTGPASVEAIKQGELGFKHSTHSFLAETNADKVRWTKDDKGEHHLVSIDTAYIGRALLTKQPFIYDPHGDADFQDVKGLYKHPEGSKEERMAFLHALRLRKKRNLDDEIFSDPEYGIFNIYHIEGCVENDVKVKFDMSEPETALFGQPINAVLKLQNSENYEVVVEVCLRMKAMYYNGATGGLIKKQVKSVTVKPLSEMAVVMEVSPIEYAAQLVEFTLVKLHCTAIVKKNNFTWVHDIDFNVEMPEIIISAAEELTLNKEGVLVFQFKNLLQTKLTQCKITYEAPGIGRNVQLPCKDIGALEEVRIEHKVKPTSPGQILLNAMFSSKQLGFLGGSALLMVQ